MGKTHKDAKKRDVAIKKSYQREVDMTEKVVKPKKGKGSFNRADSKNIKE